MIASDTLDLKRITISELADSNPIELSRCGQRDIDKWVQEKARPLSSINRIKIFCGCLDGEQTVKGFYCLSFDTKDTKNLTEQPFRNYPNIPVLYLTYIGVVRSCQRQGLGTRLLIDALARAYAVSNHVGFLGVALRSLNADTTRLYKKYGFREIDRNANPLMLLPVPALPDLFGSPSAPAAATPSNSD